MHLNYLENVGSFDLNAGCHGDFALSHSHTYRHTVLKPPVDYCLSVYLRVVWSLKLRPEYCTALVLLTLPLGITNRKGTSSGPLYALSKLDLPQTGIDFKQGVFLKVNFCELQMSIAQENGSKFIKALYFLTCVSKAYLISVGILKSLSQFDEWSWAC